ncbi:threonine/serine exporter family protein [Williamsia sp.]|uniref:threonine/serine ThrE exporter family protein n=1 Tax=Williamsia sp. TaxID=1872085 RepID=UPI001A2C867D|nr:threonine/serine exporter family protein [Williamsia sp.]MBJ7288295.1 threonine/serine exporter family protein [Williamsia sp.]
MREYIGRMLRPLAGSKRATIDTIEPYTSPLSPRQPVDLTDDGAVTEVLDLAIKVGSVLLDSGTGAIDTQTQIRFVAGMFGVERCDVDVTYNTIMASARRGSSMPPVTAMRTVHYRSLDFTRLAQVDRLIRKIRSLAVTPGEAHLVIDEIIAAPHPYARWVATLAWSTMAAALSVTLGGNWLVAVVSFLTTAVIYRLNQALNRLGTPVFFQQIAGGFVAVIPAAIVYQYQEALGVGISPTLVIAAGVIVLLSGLSLVGSVQDAITGAPITGVARFFELLILTGGIIAGVSVAIKLLESTGIYLPTITSTTQLGLTDAPAQILGGGIAAGAYALASYAENRALPVAFMGGLIGAAVSAGAALAGIGGVIAGGMAALTVGFAGGLLARRALTPPLVVAVAGITPLLPGLAVYRGLYGVLNEQTLDGFTAIASALGIGAALAAGVTLGEFIARTLRRPRIPSRPTRALLTARSALRPKRFTRPDTEPQPVADPLLTAITEPLRAQPESANRVK